MLAHLGGSAFRLQVGYFRVQSVQAHRAAQQFLAMSAQHLGGEHLSEAKPQSPLSAELPLRDQLSLSHPSEQQSQVPQLLCLHVGQL